MKKEIISQEEKRYMWFWFALGSAVFAALTSILAKIGIEGVNSNLATAIRTMVVVVMAWGMVLLTGTLGQAMEKYPVILALYEADMEASKILEAES